MGMDSEVLSPSEVALMAPVSNKPLEFPRWETPSWALENPDPNENEEYFDENGRLHGGVRNFGNRFLAWKFAGTAQQNDGTSYVQAHDVGVYFTREQAKAAVVKS